MTASTDVTDAGRATGADALRVVPKRKTELCWGQRIGLLMHEYEYRDAEYEYRDAEYEYEPPPKPRSYSYSVQRYSYSYSYSIQSWSRGDMDCPE
jgi:hypothetical protein